MASNTHSTEDSMMHDVQSSPVTSSASETINQSTLPPSTLPSRPVSMTTAAFDKHSQEEQQQQVEDESFDDSSGDDELVTSIPVSTTINLPSPPSLHQAVSASDPEVMRAFYQRLFPFRYLFQWLNHSPLPSTDFQNREFAFTLQNDAYLRFQSFASADLLRKQCMQLVPSRFEIGPVYSANPRDRNSLRKASMFRPISKELVFDIDMTDYDNVRTCCSGASICKKCWGFIAMAIKVVDAALRHDFGFKHILWVYSGRRGAHAWVCDRRARQLDDQRRRAIAGYMELLKGSDKGGKKVNVRHPLHPHLQRSLRILSPYFQDHLLTVQDPWSDCAKAEHLLSLLPDAALNAALRLKWLSAPERTSASKWSDIDALAALGTSPTLDTKLLMEAKQDIILEYTYPRLDADVSKKLNHLLKAPFCVHPATGRVCVPIDLRSLDEFDPLAVPTVLDLLDQIDKWDKDREKEESVDDAAVDPNKTDDWHKTDLAPYIGFFRSFVAALLKEDKLKRKTDSETIDF